MNARHQLSMNNDVTRTPRLLSGLPCRYERARKCIDYHEINEFNRSEKVDFSRQLSKQISVHIEAPRPPS